MAVNYWTSPNDANYRNQHAECRGIGFFAFPHQSYTARAMDVYGRVGNFSGQWYVNVGIALPNGRDDHRFHGEFGGKDDAFEYAADRMWELINQEGE
jgi:hypothetical protein